MTTTMRPFPITKEHIEQSSAENDCDDLIKTINNKPIYTRSLELGKDWVVVLVMYGTTVSLRAMHRTEDKQTKCYSNLQVLLFGIEEEFGPEYLPDLPVHVLEPELK